MGSELIRKRTDALLSALTDSDYDLSEYLSEIDVVKSPLDAATLAVNAEEVPYSMKDLNGPMAPSKMVIPQNMNEFLNGHTQISTSYAGDWPIAANDNRFGKHHPFDPESNSCPLLHGAAHGDPEYPHHILRFIGDPMDAHREGERDIRIDLKGSAEIMGDPSYSMADHYTRDRNRYSDLSDEGYIEAKTEELRDNFGLLPLLFGLEYQTSEHRDAFMEQLQKLAEAEQDSPDAEFAMNQIKVKGGIGWNRALRNWRDRFTPLLAWWMRPADRSGPVEAHPDPMAFDRHHTSPWKTTEEGMSANHNYHWWEPFQYWGGAGRDAASLLSLFSQSYSMIFNDSWLSELLFHGLPLEGRHTLAGSHFPEAANSPTGQGEAANIISSASVGDLDFERRRGNWGSASHHQHLHPSEIEGQGDIMAVPHTAYALSPFGLAMLSVAEHGEALPMSNHPNSTPEYHALHNRFFAYANNTLTRESQRLAQLVMQQLGPEMIIGPQDDNDNVEANTIARGNIQQVLAAANMSLMRNGQADEDDITFALPTGGMDSIESEEEGRLGPVLPTSQGVIPPIFNSGNTDAWGHLMPATLTWRYNPDLSQIDFGQAEQPFTIMQRTAHEGHVRHIDPAYNLKQIMTADKPINILTQNYLGYPTIVADLHKSDDEYEPTGIFNEDMISPAHVIKDLDDLGDLKGFSGDWVVQKKPAGKRMLVKKDGKMISPQLPKEISKDLKGMKGDFSVDAYLKGKTLTVVDLLVHKGSDLHFEPLSDRINVLKTIYHSTDNVHFPAPNSCTMTDEDGLVSAVASFDKGKLLIRDSHSAFIKNKELHPKWVLFANDDISKTLIYPPLPELLIKDDTILLEYPEILLPVTVRFDSDENGMFVKSYEGVSYLIKQAKSQFPLWSPVAAFILKDGEGGGDASLTTGEDSVGTWQPLYSTRSRRKKRRVKKAPLLEPDGEEDPQTHMMRHVRTLIDDREEALTTEELAAEIDGLEAGHLKRFGEEFGIEPTEDGKWTLNQAIDDEIDDTSVAKVWARGNMASADGGAWSGMQADITAPMGPTEIMEEENTTFGDPRQGRDDDRENIREIEEIPQISVKPQDEVEKPEIEIGDGKAVMRFPKREKNDEEDENEVLPAIRTDDPT